MVVDCFLNGQIIASYDFTHGTTLAPASPPTKERLIEEAKLNMIDMNIAKPPFFGIEFEVR
jgi:hypothetical protein